VSATGAPKEPRRPPSTAGEPYAVRQVRESAQALLAEGKVEEAFEFCVSALDAVLRKTRQLELLLAKLQKQRLGTRSERIDPAQLQMLFEELCRQGGEEPPADPEAEAREDASLDREIEEAEQAGKEQGTAGGGRRRQAEVRTAGVERRIHRSEIPEAERHCAPCGVDKQRIGEDVTTSLEYVPGHLVEHEYHQDKYACPSCREGVTTAEGPERVIERNTADASLLAHVVVSKYVDHCPLHRLHHIYARSGASIPVSTLSDWAGDVADLLWPLADQLGKRILAADVVKTDATGIKVLAPMSPQNIERGTMWCYVGDDRDVVFRYAPTGEGETGPWEFLAGRTGYVQADAASVFDRIFNGQVASAVEIGCWAHGRRRMVDLQDMDCRVAYPLKLIGRLYRIEHLADAKGLSIDQRTSLRKQRSQGILERLKRWLVTTHASEPPSADLAKATAYILNHWVALTRFVDDGRLSLDNNLCEQQLRAIALGRRNYLFCGSHKAAERAAVLYSLTRTCAQYGVPPLPYLTNVLRRLARGWPQSRLEELLPHRWEAAPANQP
jgi:transposase